MRYLALVYSYGRWSIATNGGRLLVTSDPEQVHLAGRADGPPPLIEARVLNGIPHLDLEDWKSETRANYTFVGTRMRHLLDWAEVTGAPEWLVTIGERAPDDVSGASS